MSKAVVLLEQYYEISELHDTFIGTVAKESGASVGEIEKAIEEFEKALKRTIDPKQNPRKFFGILTNLIKNRFGFGSTNGGRSV